MYTMYMMYLYMQIYTDLLILRKMYPNTALDATKIKLSRYFLDTTDLIVNSCNQFNQFL